MSGEAVGFGPGAQTRLRFWSANMDMIHKGGMSWPGFSYTKEEKERMAAIAKTLPGGTFGLWLYLIGPAVFIALAAAIIVGLWLPAMDMLFPNPADVTPLPFVLLLAAAALLALSLGFWAVMTVGTAIAVLIGGAGAGYAAEAGDAALYAKARRQFRRMILVICGLFVPGCWLWITFHIEAGPVITALKLAAIAVMLLSGYGLFRRR
ncbi:MAG TPA: hypothetical protein VMU06_23510 [Stellaceae bacterium]|nr:hypothetical protein [Stellaceae bacterium]